MTLVTISERRGASSARLAHRRVLRCAFRTIAIDRAAKANTRSQAAGEDRENVHHPRRMTYEVDGADDADRDRKDRRDQLSFQTSIAGHAELADRSEDPNRLCDARMPLERVGQVLGRELEVQDASVTRRRRS